MYFSKIEKTGSGDLVLFRDAVVTYCAALRAKQAFHCDACEEAARLLSWLGVEFEPGSGKGTSYIDPSRAECYQNDIRLLVSGGELPSDSLSEFQKRGLLGTTLFAALVRSSYGPNEAGFFPTQSELGFYFEDSLLVSDGARWDEDYLADCQEFFFEELTPDELLRLAVESVDEAGHSMVSYRSELKSVLFLIGEQEHSLRPLTKFLERLFQPQDKLPELERLLTAIPEWDREGISAAWGALEAPSRQAIKTNLLGDAQAEPTDILLACGRGLLEWRARL